MEKEALRQATAERDERNRKKREARERRRLLEKEKRLRLQTIAIQEIQRCWRGKLGRNKFQNRSKWIAKKKQDREELARRKATRIQSMVRGRKERRTQRSRRDKKNAAPC